MNGDIVRPFIVLFLLAALAQPAAAQVDFTINPLFRPKGAIVNKGSGRYYVWYEGSAWHLRSTAPKNVKFHGSVTVSDGRITSCRLIGREQNQDTFRFSEDRKTVSFNFLTRNYSDGLDLKMSGPETATVTFYLAMGKQKRAPLQAVKVGEKQQTPKRWPITFPIKPNRTMFGNRPSSPSATPRAPPGASLLLSFAADDFAEQDGKTKVRDGSPGKLENAVHQASPAAGKVGGGVAFDPNASAIFTPLAQDKVRTIALWVRPSEFGDYRSILSGGGNNLGYSFNFKQNGKIQFTYGTGTTYKGFACPHGMQRGTWSHMAVVLNHEAKSFAYYVNGKPLHHQANVDIAGLDKCKLVFSVNWKGHAFDGSIDEVAAYERVLTASEIAQLYQLGAAGLDLHGAKP